MRPKPFPAVSWAEFSREVRAWNARSSVVPFRSPSSTTRWFGSAATALASASAPKSRETVQNPSLDVTRTDPRCATYTASGPRAVATVVRSARTSAAASAFDSAGLVLANGPTSPRTTFTGRVSDSGSLLHSPTVPRTTWYGYAFASPFSYVPRA